MINCVPGHGQRVGRFAWRGTMGVVGKGARVDMTARQDTVRQALATAGTFISAQDLHARLRSAGHKIGLTTVYRALQALAARGELDVLNTGDGQQAYRACGSDTHHHHLVCRKCGTTVEVSGPAMERWAEAVGGDHGFTDVTHTVEIFGTCPDCAAALPTGPRLSLDRAAR
jgi:Fur family transcriptional regulator, ferric uptake regulator